MALIEPEVRDWPENIAKECTIAVITSRFNSHITAMLKEICIKTLAKYGVADDHLIVADVPGALELPFAATVLAHNDRVDGIIGLGCIMRGETTHYDIVSEQSARGLMDIQITHALPVINGILTVENEAQAIARIHQKATDAATGVIEMILWRQKTQPGFSHHDLDLS